MLSAALVDDADVSSMVGCVLAGVVSSSSGVIDPDAGGRADRISGGGEDPVGHRERPRNLERPVAQTGDRERPQA